MNIAIVGGGIVGLAIGYKLQSKKQYNIDLYEKSQKT